MVVLTRNSGTRQAMGRAVGFLLYAFAAAVICIIVALFNRRTNVFVKRLKGHLTNRSIDRLTGNEHRLLGQNQVGDAEFAGLRGTTLRISSCFGVSFRTCSDDGRSGSEKVSSQRTLVQFSTLLVLLVTVTKGLVEVFSGHQV